LRAAAVSGAPMKNLRGNATGAGGHPDCTRIHAAVFGPGGANGEDHDEKCRRDRVRASTSPGPRPEEPLPATIPARGEFRCSVCGAEFVSRAQLGEHERLEHRTP